MHIVALAWIFVVLLMVAAEASSTQGTLLGALVTLLLYGALPLTIVLYVLGTPARRRARLLAESAAQQAQAEQAAAGAASPGEPSSPDGDGRSQASGAPVSPEREKP